MSDVREFGAAGDGQTDDTQAVVHALKDGDGTLHFPPGDYLIKKTITVELDASGRFAIDGSGGAAKIIMAGAGAAFHLIGTHGATADPQGFQPNVWSRQRMPTALNIEIQGGHESAAGFLVEGTMQSTFEGVLLRELDYGICVYKRARNVLISHCHIYNNRGIGVYFDRLNLHQAIITGSHISYCKRGGIRIEGSEIRNLQITGNDIEYNYDVKATESADVWIDSSADKSSIREGTISSNTIQAKYSPGGANVRMIGWNPENNHKAGMFSISGNLIGSQETNVHLKACRGVVVSGNVLYSGHRRNLLVEGSRNIVASGNCFDHNPDYGVKELCTGVTIVDSQDVVFNGSLVHDCQTGENTVKDAPALVRHGLVEIIRSKRVNLSGCEILDGVPHGIYVEESANVSITGCSLLESRTEPKTRSPIRFKGHGKSNFVSANTISKGTQGAVEADEVSGVKVDGNLMEGA